MFGDVLDTTAVTTHLTTHGEGATLLVLDDVFEHFLGVTTIGVAINHGAFATFATPKLIDGHVGDFAFDVPQGHVDTADGVVEHGAVAPVGVDHHQLPHVFAVAGVTTDQQWLEIIFDRFDHQCGPLGKRGTAQTKQPILVGFDFDDDDTNAVRSGQKRPYTRDFHCNLH